MSVGKILEIKFCPNSTVAVVPCIYTENLAKCARRRLIYQCLIKPIMHPAGVIIFHSRTLKHVVLEICDLVNFTFSLLGLRRYNFYTTEQYHIHLKTLKKNTLSEKRPHRPPLYSTMWYLWISGLYVCYISANVMLWAASSPSIFLSSGMWEIASRL